MYAILLQYEIVTLFIRLQMVVEKDSSILGYPGEISRPLDADHHAVCKFASLEDPNYKSVRSALLTLIRNYNILGECDTAAI